jgi:hypothetical protein
VSELSRQETYNQDAWHVQVWSRRSCHHDQRPCRFKKSASRQLRNLPRSITPSLAEGCKSVTCIPWHSGQGPVGTGYAVPNNNRQCKLPIKVPMSFGELHEAWKTGSLNSTCGTQTGALFSNNHCRVWAGNNESRKMYYSPLSHKHPTTIHRQQIPFERCCHRFRSYCHRCWTVYHSGEGLWHP